ncbi:MAG: glycosyltransferase, partial [Planctomycetota bacterium]
PHAPPPLVVRNGVTLPPPDPEPPPQPALPASYLLHVGHVEPRKNLGVVVDALAALPTAQRPQLWLAGEDAGALTELQARAQAKSVTLHAFGVVTDDAVTSLYRHARAVVVPSVHEGFGLPALEALAHGKPLLVSAAGALPEVVGTCARVLPPHNVAAWTAAIAAATTSPVDATACRTHAARFSWRDAAAQLLGIWRALSG